MTKFNTFGQILGGQYYALSQLGNVKLSYGSTSPSYRFDYLNIMLVGDCQWQH